MLALLVPDITNPHNFGADPRRGGAGPRRRLHPGARRHPGQSAELEADPCRPAGLGGRRVRARLAAGLPERTCRRSPGAGRSCCSTGRRTGFRAWSPTPSTAAGRSSSTWHALGHRRDRLPRRAAERLERTASAGGRCRHAAGSGVEVVRHGPFAAHRGARRGRRRRRPGRRGDRAGGVQRPARDRRAAPAGASRCRGPGEVSVVGFDDIFGADFCHPPLTTVASPAEQAGRSSIDAAARRAAGPADRASCCRPRARGLDQALHGADATPPAYDHEGLAGSQHLLILMITGAWVSGGGRSAPAHDHEGLAVLQHPPILMITGAWGGMGRWVSAKRPR